MAGLIDPQYRLFQSLSSRARGAFAFLSEALPEFPALLVVWRETPGRSRRKEENGGDGGEHGPRGGSGAGVQGFGGSSGAFRAVGDGSSREAAAGGL